jgi:nitrate reductase delta subunit
MGSGNGVGRALGLFAGILDYPRENLAALAEESERELAGDHPEAASLLGEFLAFLRSVPPARMEEIYTATFDLQAACCPYLGVHLFGEGYKRRVFLARLREIYDSREFRVTGELPDHLTSVLRFLAEAGGEDDGRALREDGLVPALEKMSGAFRESSGNPYGKVLNALRILLRPAEAGAEGAPVPGGEV